MNKNKQDLISFYVKCYFLRHKLYVLYIVFQLKISETQSGTHRKVSW